MCGLIRAWLAQELDIGCTVGLAWLWPRAAVMVVVYERLEEPSMIHGYPPSKEEFKKKDATLKRKWDKVKEDDKNKGRVSPTQLNQSHTP